MTFCGTNFQHRAKWKGGSRQAASRCLRYSPLSHLKAATSVFGSRWSAPGGAWKEDKCCFAQSRSVCLRAVLICSIYVCGKRPRALMPQELPQLCSTDSSLLPACFVTLLKNDRKGSGLDPCEKASVVERGKKERKLWPSPVADQPVDELWEDTSHLTKMDSNECNYETLGESDGLLWPSYH